MANNEAFRATVIGQLSDLSAVVFDFGYQDKTGGSAHLDTGIAAGDFQTLVQAKLVACLPEAWVVIRYRFACTSGTHAGEVGYVEVEPPVQGALSNDGRLPNEICISLKRNTGHASRSDRGRVFFSPVSGDLTTPDPNVPDRSLAIIHAVRDLLKATLTTQSTVLTPVLVKNDGTTNGRAIINVAIGAVYVQRKSRRPRVLV